MYNNDKVVIFDWGGVVESHFLGESNYYLALKNVLGYFNKEIKLLDEKTILKKWSTCDYDEEGRCISEVNDSDSILKWFNRIKLEFDLKCSYDEFYDIYKKETDNIKFYKEVVEFAHSLKDKCRIGILSNLAKIDKERIDKHYDLSKFDFVFLSFELNYKKPKDKIYEIVEEKLDIPRQNILFIDDNDKNINVAKDRGWTVCQATGLEFAKIKESVNKFLEIN